MAPPVGKALGVAVVESVISSETRNPPDGRIFERGGILFAALIEMTNGNIDIFP